MSPHTITTPEGNTKLTHLVKLEREKGIEPSTLAWKAKVIPFYDSRLAPRYRLELQRTVLETAMLPLHHQGIVGEQVVITATPGYYYSLGRGTSLDG